MPGSEHWPAMTLGEVALFGIGLAAVFPLLMGCVADLHPGISATPRKAATYPSRSALTSMLVRRSRRASACASPSMRFMAAWRCSAASASNPARGSR